MKNYTVKAPHFRKNISITMIASECTWDRFAWLINK